MKRMLLFVGITLLVFSGCRFNPTGAVEEDSWTMSFEVYGTAYSPVAITLKENGKSLDSATVAAGTDIYWYETYAFNHDDKISIEVENTEVRVGSGVVDNQSPFQLIDSTASFWGTIEAGDFVVNTTDATSAMVTRVVPPAPGIALDLTQNIFTEVAAPFDNYEIYRWHDLYSKIYKGTSEISIANGHQAGKDVDFLVETMIWHSF